VIDFSKLSLAEIAALAEMGCEVHFYPDGAIKSMSFGRSTTVITRDETAEKRREYDRKRKAEAKMGKVNSTVIPPDSTGIPPEKGNIPSPPLSLPPQVSPTPPSSPTHPYAPTPTCAREGGPKPQTSGEEDDFWTAGLSQTQDTQTSRPDQGAIAASQKTRRAAWSPSPLQIQVAGWFGRRPTTQWDEREIRAWKALKMEDEDMEILDWFYMRSGYQYLRRDLKALLNNWRGEVDKARNYNPEKENDRR
jgi:hypothetical protein